MARNPFRHPHQSHRWKPRNRVDRTAVWTVYGVGSLSHPLRLARSPPRFVHPPTAACSSSNCGLVGLRGGLFILPGWLARSPDRFTHPSTVACSVSRPVCSLFHGGLRKQPRTSPRFKNEARAPRHRLLGAHNLECPRRRTRRRRTTIPDDVRLADECASLDRHVQRWVARWLVRTEKLA